VSEYAWAARFQSAASAASAATAVEGEIKQNKESGTAAEEEMVPIKMTPKTPPDADKKSGNSKDAAKGKKRLKKGAKKSGKGGGDDNDNEEGDPLSEPPKSGATKNKKNSGGSRKDKSIPDEDELYGLNGLYPAPYLAGKCDNLNCLLYLIFHIFSDSSIGID